MGQESSRPSSDGAFSSESPVRLSPEVAGNLQSSPESDSTRAKDLELHIQARVRQELSRLEAEQTRTIKEIEEQISALPDEQKPGGKPSDLGRDSVMREIDELKAKLGKRKLKDDVVKDPAVAKARADVTNCLRINDRRPLDCWKEVEAFKQEVGKVEKAFLGRVLE